MSYETHEYETASILTKRKSAKFKRKNPQSSETKERKLCGLWMDPETNICIEMLVYHSMIQPNHTQ